MFLACSSQRFRQRLEKRALEQGRLDDNPHAIERRVDTFKQNVPLIVKYYQEKGVVIRVRLCGGCWSRAPVPATRLRGSPLPARHRSKTRCWLPA